MALFMESLSLEKALLITRMMLDEICRPGSHRAALVAAANRAIGSGAG